MDQTLEKEEVLVEDQFTIKDDNTADWALRKIQEEEGERDRLIAIAENQIEQLKEQIEDISKKCDNTTAFMRSKLAEYFATVPHKNTKTQEKYKLLSGELVFTKPSVKIVHDEDKLLEYLEESGGEDFIKTTKKVNWAEYKKILALDGNNVIDTDTGEVVNACTVEEVPAKFNVKF